MKKSIGILIYNDAEVLDFCGPFEVFSVASELQDHSLFDVFTIAKTTEAVRAVNGLSVNPDYSFADVPQIDVLIIAGGAGSRALVNDTDTLAFIKKVHKDTLYTASICSGARLLAKLGLLSHKPYTTHHLVYDHLAELAPDGLPQKEKRYVQSGKMFTSGGISAGIDLSFHMLGILTNDEIVIATAEYMEYRLM
nr:DJ-1/PfpI family protein [uncultured Mucilaginibacter sp.]